MWYLHLWHTSLHIKLCGMYIRTETFSLDWLCGMYIRMKTYSLDSPCVIYIRTEMFFWDSLCGMHIPTKMIFLVYHVGCTYLRKWLGFDASPDRTRPQPGSQEGLPPTISGSCGKDTLSHTLTWRRFQMPSRKGVKNVCLGPTRTSVSISESPNCISVWPKLHV